jgi:hypothetical protein
MPFVLILPPILPRPRHHTITLRRDKHRRIIGLWFLERTVYRLLVQSTISETLSREGYECHKCCVTQLNTKCTLSGSEMVLM